MKIRYDAYTLNYWAEGTINGLHCVGLATTRMEAIADAMRQYEEMGGLW